MATSSTPRCWDAFTRRDHEEAVRLLGLQDPEVLCRDEHCLLFYSIINGWLDVTRDLVTVYRFDPREYYYYGEPCICTAAKGNHIDIVEYLIKEWGCDPMKRTDAGQKCVPLLHYVASEGLLDVLKCMVMNINGHIMDERYRDTDGQTVLHHAIRHIDVVQYLIDQCNCDIMVTDVVGQTPLHHAARWSIPDIVEYISLTGNCDPLAKDNNGVTPLQLAKEREYDSDTVIDIFKKFGDIKISHPIDSYVNVLLVGNSGAGKSSLSHVIKDTATGSIALGSFRNVGVVVPCTAGIIPYKLQHRTLGNIILHDFAGHSEYYSSHSAVIENLLQGSGGVFLIVVNILEKEAVKQLHQWLTVVRNEAQKALIQCHVIVIVSHKDKISDPVERRRKKEIQEIIITMERCDTVFLDCRKLGGSGLVSFFNKLSSACESIRSKNGRNKFNLYHHEMYRLLVERKENILTFSDLMSAGKDNYVIPDKREDVLDALHSLHSTGLISVLKSEYKVWVVVNKGILLTEVDGILFAPDTFKEHVDIASNTGIVCISGLTRLFPKYDPDMLICFLKNLELCQELDPSFLRMTNLHQLAVEEEEEGGRERRGERLLFFPCLLSTDRPDEMTSQVYQFGWCLQCTSKHHFFPPRYFHVLSLHLALKFSLSKGKKELAEKLNRKCKFWSNGLHWFNGHGVGSLVEIVDESQCVLVMISCEKGYSDNMLSVRRDVIGEVMSVYKESCHSLEVKELVIDPNELAYPVNTPKERTVYDVCDLLSAVKEGRPFFVSNKGQTELKEILLDESLSDISNLSLLGGRDIKDVIEIIEEFKTPLTTIKLETTIQNDKPATNYSATQISEYNDDQQKVILTIRDLVDIVRVLKDGSFQTIKWFDLGLYLGLIHNDLKVIETNYPRDAERCLRECLAKWITDDIEATWNKLAIAVGEVGETSVAEYIHDVHEVIEITEDFKTPLTTIKLETKIQNDEPATNYSPTQISEYNDDQEKVFWTIQNLVEVKQVLKDGNFQTIKWFDLGLYLGLSFNDLKTIEHNYPRDAEQCLTECLAKWLKEDLEATRNKLSIAAGKAITFDKR
uniref:Death domain-containing protein n=1 Tax=Amphimedon queenslandica TaxID=400682 RepID=A0A1X7UDF7_AMPQE